MRADYQLIFEEYREAMRAARRRLIQELRRRSRGRFLIGAVALILVSLLIGRFLDWLMPSPTPATKLPVQDALRPYLFFFILVWTSVVALVFLARQRTRHVDRIVWDGSPQLQQPRAVELDAGGMTITDIFSRTEYRWLIFRGFEETANVFVLFVSDYSFQVLPKRAFDGATAEELRRLLRAHAQPPIRAFPVLPPTQHEAAQNQP
jgi:hypothetical protein